MFFKKIRLSDLKVVPVKMALRIWNYHEHCGVENGISFMRAR